MPDVQEEVHLILPNDPERYWQFIDNDLQSHMGLRGAKTVKKHLIDYMTLQARANGHLSKAMKSIEIINGHTSPAQNRAYSGRKSTTVARKFYESLINDPEIVSDALRQHCKVFGLNVNDYDSQEEVIDALVVSHIAMQNKNN